MTLGEKSVKKIFTALLLIFIVGINCLFSACSLVTINNTKYLAQVVAQTDGVKITMEDLILGYNSFGYQYLQNGKTEEEAVKQTLEDLIDRELLFIKAKEQIGELSITKKNEIYKEIFDGINSQIKEYVDEIVENEGIELPEIEETTNETAGTVFTPYVKKVVYDEESNKYVRVVNEEEEQDTELIEFTLTEYGVEGLAKRGFSKYINVVKKNRDAYKNLSDDKIFEKEVERIYKIYEKNKYLELFQEDYENKMEIQLEKVTQKYIELVKNSAFTYSQDESSYNSAMQNSANEVYYQPFAEDKYIQVAHILIKYSDEQTEKINDLKTKLNDGGIDPESYEREIEKIAQDIKAKAKVDGKETGEEKSYLEIFTEVKNAIDSQGTDEGKLAKFIEMIEKYNQDDGMISALNNQTQYYTVNLDTNVADTMVKPFADASRELYSSGSKDYTLYATPVLSDYGYHFIFRIGVVKNDYNIQSVDTVTLEYLYNTEAMKGTGKSLFDKMLELVDASQYSTYQTEVIGGLREGLTIKYNKTAYERLYK